MKSHCFLEHTADVLLEASGSSFEEALEAAADGMFETIADAKKLGADRHVRIREKAPDLESLVVFALSDLLGEMEAEEIFLKMLKVERFGKEAGNFVLEATAYGSEQDPKLGKIVVKAVTHHLLKVEEKKGSWKIRVLLDI